MTRPTTDDLEWLETDGRGGFAPAAPPAGSVRGRYHGVLLTATTPPTGRMMLVNGLETWLVRGSNREALSTQRYDGNVLYPDRVRPARSRSRQSPGHAGPYAWRATPRSPTISSSTGARAPPSSPGVGQACPTMPELEVRPLLSGRDHHALHHENRTFDFTPERRGDSVAFRPFAGVPPVIAAAGAYGHGPTGIGASSMPRSASVASTASRTGDSQGAFRFRLGEGPACLVLATERVRVRTGARTPASCARVAMVSGRGVTARPVRLAARPCGGCLRRAARQWEDARRRLSVVHRLGPGHVRRDAGGSCSRRARRHLDDRPSNLLEWSSSVSEGMLPNRFPDREDSPEFNAVDAALWFVIVAGEFEREARGTAGLLDEQDRGRLHAAVDAILAGYAGGTRFGIRVDGDGLLMAGAPGVQLTWMDARVGDHVMTPRVGKPVEVQALWLNALAEGARRQPRWNRLLDRGLVSFKARFWNAARGCLYDVVDVDHVQGRVDAAVHPEPGAGHRGPAAAAPRWRGCATSAAGGRTRTRDPSRAALAGAR